MRDSILRGGTRTARALLYTGLITLAGASGAVAAGKITGAQVQNGSLTGRDIRNHSLTSRDFSGSVRGPRGLQGAQGPQGQPGLPGKDATLSIQRKSDKTIIAAGEIGRGEVTCPDGAQVTGGGYTFAAGHAPVTYSDDEGTGSTWYVGVDNSASATSVTVSVVVFCLASG
jgi:hypothetical protein